MVHHMKQLSPVALKALETALSQIYWYKSDLKSFMYRTLPGTPFLAMINWDGYKREVAVELVDYLAKNQNRHLAELLKLCEAVCSMDNFSHLAKLEDGKRKAKAAEVAVAELRNVVATSPEVFKDRTEIKEQIEKSAQAGARRREFETKLAEVRQCYISLCTEKSEQKRGYQLERIMYDLFSLFDLDPKASFRNTGEQVDGAFSLDGTDYLFEAKWTGKPIAMDALDALAGKLSRKLDNTLGLFLSISGFSEQALGGQYGGRRVVLLMDGVDLMAVLDGRIDFVSLLVRKRKHAAFSGNIYLKVNEILNASTQSASSVRFTQMF